MHLRPIDYVLWFASPTLQAGVVIAMLRRGLHRDYPYFFNYTLLGVVAEPLLFVLYRTSYASYYYGYYVNLGLSVVMSFAVLQEIFRDAFRPYEALRDLSVILFRWSALVVLLVAVMWAIGANGKPDHGFVLQAITLADRSVRLMQCGLVFFLLLFSEYLGIPRRSFLFGISLGFGLFASVNMLVFTGLSRHGSIIKHTALSKINSAAYMAAVLIWLGYTLASEPSRSMAEESNVQRSKDWNSALEDARGPVVADSLLDTMDRTVERLLYPPEESPVKISAEPS